jgi:energy-coupling factor transporter ATP-binding protein EcfA2
MVTAAATKTNGKPRKQRALRSSIRPPGRAIVERPWPAVRSVSVDELFAKYTYNELELYSRGSKQPLALFYGANGSGKTTLLKLIYGALSPSLSEGHRTYFAKTPFRRFELELLDGTSIQVTKTDGLIGPYRVIVDGPISAELDIEVDADGDVPQQPSVHSLSTTLRQLGVDLLFVRDDRRIQTTYRFIEEDDDYEFEEYDRLRSTTGVGRLDRSLRQYRQMYGRHYVSPSAMREVGLYVDPVISAVNDWIKDYAYRLGSTGDQDASFVYLDVLKALKTRVGKAAKTDSANALRKDLLQLSKRAEKFNRYGLISQYPFSAFIDAVSDANPHNAEYMSAVLNPFVDSIKKRLNALETLQEVLEKFEFSLNSYLRDKHVDLDVLNGITFHDQNGEIDASDLSSGERQLVFLFSAALLSRDGNSIFLVDEPELSLNFEWQRTVVQSLLDLARGGRTQFIMASHSIEILTKHRNSVIELG